MGERNSDKYITILKHKIKHVSLLKGIKSWVLSPPLGICAAHVLQIAFPLKPAELVTPS